MENEPKPQYVIKLPIEADAYYRMRAELEWLKIYKQKVENGSYIPPVNGASMSISSPWVLDETKEIFTPGENSGIAERAAELKTQNIIE